MDVRETGQARFLTPPPKDIEIQVEQFLRKKRSQNFSKSKNSVWVIDKL